MIHDYAGNIYLIGFMASGKSTLGHLLAKKLNRAFLDTDKWVEVKYGKTIPEIFNIEGEKKFRNLEKQCIKEVTQMENMVIAVGGGAVLDAENQLRLKNTGMTLYLKCTPAMILNRIKGDQSRPLLQEKNGNILSRIKSMMQQREPFYLMADITIQPGLTEPPDRTIGRIIRKLEEYH